MKRDESKNRETDEINEKESKSSSVWTNSSCQKADFPIWKNTQTNYDEAHRVSNLTTLFSAISVQSSGQSVQNMHQAHCGCLLPSFNSITSQVFSDACNFVKLVSTSRVAVPRTNAPRKSYAGVILQAPAGRTQTHWTLTKCWAICLSCKHPFTESRINSAWRTAGRRRARYHKSRKLPTLLSSSLEMLRNVDQSVRPYGV